MFSRLDKAAARRKWPARPAPALFSRWAAVAIALVLTACGGGAGGGDAPIAPDPGVSGTPYFTFALGDRWRTLDGTTLRATRVVRQEGSSFTLREQGADGSVDEYGLVRSESAITAVPLPTSDPLTAAVGPYDVARFPLRVGASFRAADRTINGILDLNEDGRLDNVTVRIDVTVVGFERVVVPAGTFDNALRQRTVFTFTVLPGGGGAAQVITSTSDDWYAPGVGPVRSVLVTESDGRRVASEEVLRDYRVGALSSDTVAPTIVSRTPAAGSLGNNIGIRLEFSEEMDTSTLPTGALDLRNDKGETISGNLLWDGSKAVAFVPDREAAFTTGRYTATLRNLPEDWVGNRLVGTVPWSFDLDRSGPVVVAQSPAPNAVDVPLNAVLSFTFDEDVVPGPTGIVATLTAGSSTVPVTARAEGRQVVVTPSVSLGTGVFYTLVVHGLRDRFGNAPSSGATTTFTALRADPGRFAYPEPLAALAGRGVFNARLADMNGDTRPDLVALAYSALTGGIEWLVVLRKADGSFEDRATTAPDPNCGAVDMAVADVDADGLPDLIGSRSMCGTFWIRQTSPGIWGYQGSVGYFSDQALPIRLAGQPRPGLVSLGTADGAVLLQRPRGAALTTAFEAPELLVTGVNTTSRTLQVADVNGDGREDILLATGPGDRILMALQGVDGRFDVRTLTVPAADQIRLIADLDGDGRVDLLLAEGPGSTALVLLQQQPDGSFAGPGKRYVLPVSSGRALHADIDGDGRRDIVLSMLLDGTNVGNLGVFVPRADGSFSLTPLFEYPTPLPLGSDAAAVGEFSGEGPVDVLLAGQLIRGRTPVVLPMAGRGAGLGALGGGRASGAIRSVLRP